jgi:hypothetical protein
LVVVVIEASTIIGHLRELAGLFDIAIRAPSRLSAST